MNITERILFLHPGAKFYCPENDYQKIVWGDNPYSIPTLSELESIPQGAIADTNLTSEANLAFDLTAKDKTILKQIFLIRKQLNPALTLEQFKAELISDYKGFK